MNNSELFALYTARLGLSQAKYEAVTELANACFENANKQQGTYLAVDCPIANPPARLFPRRKCAPKYIVMHYTAGRNSSPGEAAKSATSTARGGRGASADFFVDESNIVQLNPDYTKYYSQHSGDRVPRCIDNGGASKCVKGQCCNGNSLSIEMCSRFNEAKDDGTRQTYKNKNTGKIETGLSPMNAGWELDPSVVSLAAKVCGALMAEFNIPPSNVVMHNMVSGKLCPAPWCRNAEEVNKFKNFVRLASQCKYYKIPKSDVGNENDEKSSIMKHNFINMDSIEI